MKFITKPTARREIIKVAYQSKTTSLLNNIADFTEFISWPFAGVSNSSRREHLPERIVKFPGRLEISNCVIEFDEEQQEGVKIDSLIVENLKLNGLIILQRLSEYEYECCVDWIENV